MCVASGKFASAHRASSILSGHYILAVGRPVFRQPVQLRNVSCSLNLHRFSKFTIPIQPFAVFRHVGIPLRAFVRVLYLVESKLVEHVHVAIFVLEAEVLRRGLPVVWKVGGLIVAVLVPSRYNAWRLPRFLLEPVEHQPP